MNVAEHYVYRVHWSAEDGAYVGTVAELPSLSWVADGQVEAFEGIRQLACDVVHDMQGSGEVLPEPLADRNYSGHFMIRIPPEQHRRLAIEAAEQHVSLNRLVSSRLNTPA